MVHCSVHYFAILWCSTVALCTNNFDLPLPTVQLWLNQSVGYAFDSRAKRRLSEMRESDHLSPLFQGMGTHYSFLYIGTPPQRVSVIVDTGSHHTAFPCVGCKCGKHMDPHFNPNVSNTSKIKSCGANGQKCFFRQSYSEGSSWHAFRVRDKMWVGGFKMNDLEHYQEKWTVDFDFGCQSSETGLFRTQNVDGIMGMSAAEDTLPFQLVNQKKTNTRMFAMCFRVGGGIMTLGGVDTSIHRPSAAVLPSSQARLRTLSSIDSVNKSQTVVHQGVVMTQLNRLDGSRILDSSIQFVKMIKPRGWYTVKVLDVLMLDPQTGKLQSIGGPTFKFNSGKGTIVDSGTTDTYLPSAIQANFKKLFATISGGMQYSNNAIELSKDKLARMPTIVYRMEGLDKNSVVDIDCPPSSYLEAFKGNRYSPRIYLTEGIGAVLGANFMNEYNVIFDPDQLRIGFAKSDCKYEQLPKIKTSSGAASSASSTVERQTSNPTEKQHLHSSMLGRVADNANMLFGGHASRSGSRKLQESNEVRSKDEYAPVDSIRQFPADERKILKSENEHSDSLGGKSSGETLSVIKLLNSPSTSLLQNIRSYWKDHHHLQALLIWSTFVLVLTVLTAGCVALFTWCGDNHRGRKRRH